MLYNLNESADPYEMRNLLAIKPTDAIIGKAEHLKILLVEWLKRNDGGEKRYYSDNKYNLGVGEGDIAEIKSRRTWKTTDFWCSHALLTFGSPALIGNKVYRRNEYLYVGRTSAGSFVLADISVEGPDAHHFAVEFDRSQRIIRQDGYVRVKVSYASSTNSIGSLDAHIVITTDIPGKENHKIFITG